MSLLDALLAPFSSEGLMVELIWLFCIYLILTTSVDLVMGYTGMFQLGHIGFFALGAMGTMFATHPDHLAMDMFAGILLGWAFTTAAVLLIGLPTLRLTGDYFAIATMGFALSTQFVMLGFWANGVFRVPSLNPLGCDTACLSDTALGGEIGNFVTWILGLGDVRNADRIGVELAILFAFTMATYVLIGRMKHAPFGRALKSVREDRRAAEALGKNTQMLRFKALWVSALAQSLAGSLVVHYRGLLSPSSMGFEFLVLTIMAVIVGGLGSHFGALIGALVFVVFNESSKTLSRWAGDTYPAIGENFSVAALRLMLFGALLVVLMLFRPQGILGEREVTARGIIARLRGKPQDDAQADPQGGKDMERDDK